MRLSVYDKINSQLFNSHSNLYICCVCGQITTLKESSSSMGYNLICHRCRYKIGNILDMDANDVFIKSQDIGRQKGILKDEK